MTLTIQSQLTLLHGLITLLLHDALGFLLPRPHDPLLLCLLLTDGGLLLAGLFLLPPHLFLLALHLHLLLLLLLLLLLHLLLALHLLLRIVAVITLG
ncbi:hypothetical protein D3C76_1506720 [compost metagenome]